MGHIWSACSRVPDRWDPEMGKKKKNRAENKKVTVIDRAGTVLCEKDIPTFNQTTILCKLVGTLGT